ncbi:MAG TPA: carboxymuconolactone decarboxylase family protein [Terriglobales bacterium]|nr:carboxymuconolactone decarboxylase family protein [Terriglobales bacterium]
MNLDELIDLLPAYAKDLKLNFSSLVRQQTELTPQQAWGTVAASAIAASNDELTKAAIGEAQAHLSPEALEAAKGAAAVMGMNNIFYRFQHLSSNEKYKSMPARLRMNIIRTHGVDQVDFELWCTAVSAINGCGACVDSHEKTLRDKGLAEEKILAAVRIASIIHAIASVLQAESALGNLSAIPAQTA